MSMWDRIKDQAKTRAGGARPGAGGPGGSRGGGGGGSALVSAFKNQLSSMKTELKSGAFRDASMAMCALVAAADGTVDGAERQRVESLIVTNDVLQNFPADSLRQRFNKHVDQLVGNFHVGKGAVMQEIAKVQKKPMEARAVIQTGIVIAGADGYFAQAEQQVIREVCATLGISPTEFNM
ncbi:tellurite resistance TerB family protein [Streptomyces litchfieldiae]|uniref:Tellurite resistance TerB family protein n=1 Tax=Streptomyces litchfieldiae TaxID=3075543 RepID=A0ABU2MLB6_9ACTN|nr:tellurite resistance TerB family protein [Streptomyces sp. DSM 44938]MDT0342271.1 tellurite resistance TerB family protein [Streptomyces sp. DSM 44938]